jgi:hypothetical protein
LTVAGVTLRRRSSRQRVIQTLFKVGCSRMVTARLLGAEIIIILAASGLLTLLLLGAVA